jgi:ribosomal protein L37E
MDYDTIDTCDKLKKCPLCGGAANLKYKGRFGRTIRCQDCGFGIIQRVTKYSLTWLENKLIEIWNKRVET